MEKETVKDKICVLHTDNLLSSANIILFQAFTLKKCQDAELVHKSRLNKGTSSTYKDIVLPSVPNSHSGTFRLSFQMLFKIYSCVKCFKEDSCAANRKS